MVRKKKQSIFMATVLAAVSLLAAPMAAQAAHTVPKSHPNYPSLCSNTYVNYIHTGFAASIPQKPHQLSNGQYCTPTRLVFIHDKRCTGCNALLKEYVYMECEEDHSLCGTRIQGIGH